MKNLSMIVVYGKNSGVATTAAYFGNQWWITSKDERLAWSRCIAESLTTRAITASCVRRAV